MLQLIKKDLLVSLKIKSNRVIDEATRFVRDFAASKK